MSIISIIYPDILETIGQMERFHPRQGSKLSILLVLISYNVKDFLEDFEDRERIPKWRGNRDSLTNKAFQEFRFFVPLETISHT